MVFNVLVANSIPWPFQALSLFFFFFKLSFFELSFVFSYWHLKVLAQFPSCDQVFSVPFDLVALFHVVAFLPRELEVLFAALS